MTTHQLVFLRRLGSSVALWSVALTVILTGYELGFMVLISALGLLGLWEFYSMLDVKGLPNFRWIGMICGGLLNLGSFYYFSHVGPMGSYDFEIAALLLFFYLHFVRGL